MFRVFNHPPIPSTYPEYSHLHKAADSEEAITLPIDQQYVNARHGACGWTPLLILVRNNQKAVDVVLSDIDNLFKAGANLDIQDKDSEETPLFYCARAGKVKLVQKLIQLGADPTKMNIHDSTPLHQAAHNCDIAMAKELLKHEKVKKELNEVDQNGCTALMICARFNTLSIAVASLIVEAGADPSFQGDKVYNESNNANFIFQSARTYRGRSALHYAAHSNNVKMIKFLLEKQVNKDAQDIEVHSLISACNWWFSGSNSSIISS